MTWARELEDRYPPDMTAATGAANVNRTGVSELYSDVSDEMLEASAIDAEHLQIMREVGFRSAVVVPLLGRSNAIGAITAIAAESGRRYDSSDVAFFEDLARRIALAVETTRLLAQHGVPHP